MTSATPDREDLAEALSWTSGEMTRWSETAHLDHNRWSWRGDGHGEYLREHFRDMAYVLMPTIAALIERETAKAAERALLNAADAWTHGAWADTPRHAERARDRIAAAQFFGDWLRDRARGAGGGAA